MLFHKFLAAELCRNHSNVWALTPGCVRPDRQELENFRAGQAIGQTIIISNADGASGATADGGAARAQSGQWWRPKGWQVRLLVRVS